MPYTATQSHIQSHAIQSHIQSHAIQSHAEMCESATVTYCTNHLIPPYFRTSVLPYRVLAYLHISVRYPSPPFTVRYSNSLSPQTRREYSNYPHLLAAAPPPPPLSPHQSSNNFPTASPQLPRKSCPQFFNAANSNLLALSSSTLRPCPRPRQRTFQVPVCL